MKKHLKIEDPLSVLTKTIRKDSFELEVYSPKLLPFISTWSRNVIKSSELRKIVFIVFILIFPCRSGAPVDDALIIQKPDEINAFSGLMYAIGMVETMGNNLAYNEFEDAVGIFQIRQVKLDEYNRRTGSKLTLCDMFDYKMSEKVFLYFASLVGPYNLEKIAKAWNGSGPMTEIYWERIKEYL